MKNKKTNKEISKKDLDQLLVLFSELKNSLDEKMLREFNRSLPFADLLFNRWQRAQKLGFGKDTSIYDSSVVLGNVKVGKNTWIGPYTILDGSGHLTSYLSQ